MSDLRNDLRNDLWNDHSTDAWQAALDRYPDTIDRQGSERLAEHDRWYRTVLPAQIAAREPRHLLHDELVRVVEWKMARGEWRARNLVLAKSNGWDAVKEITAAGIALIPHPSKPISTIATLAGVGPATASAVIAAAAPERYPFFDETVATQVPDLGKVTWTLGYYVKYADALRERAGELGDPWTPVMVEQALWSNGSGR